MGRRLFLVVGALVPLSLFAFSATAVADEPEPLTLSANSTRGTCTLGSVTTLDYSIAGGAPPYQLTVDGRVVEGDSTPGYIPCQPSQVWSPLEASGGDGVQRINVSVSDSTGARAYAIAEVRLTPPLPAPRYLKVSSGLDGRSAADLTAEWNVPYLPREERTGEVAIRWRSAGSDEWTIEHHVGRPVTILSYRSSWRIDASATGEEREVQVARIRHIHDLQAPEALVWSEAAIVTSAATPYELQAEATHDSIMLTWGPHATRLVYVARLHPVSFGQFSNMQTLRVENGPRYRAHFDNLLPDTLYRVEVALAQGSRHANALEQHSFELHTEPAPDDWSTPTRQATDIKASFTDGVIVVSWTPPETGSRHATRVCARPSNSKPPSLGCETVASGESHVRLSPPYGDFSGGYYQIEVSTLTAPEGVTTTELHLPTYDRATPTRGEPPAALRFGGLGQIEFDHAIPSGSVMIWTFNWPMAGAELAELSWRERGREFLSETRQTKSGDRETGEFRISTGSNVRPESLRIRLLRDGAWTPWSEPIDAPDMGGPIFGLGLYESLDGIEARWDPPEIGTEIDGYRLYVSRNGGRDSVMDVGAATRATIPVRPRDEGYFVRVVSYDDEHGEGGSGYAFYTRRTLPHVLAISLRQSGSWCPLVPGGRVEIQWTVQGGVPPFIVSIADSLGFKTDQRSGSSTVNCPERDADSRATLEAQVMDSAGNSATDSEILDDTASWSNTEEVDEDPFAVHVDLRSVHRDRVLLRWDCRYLPYEAALRWRLEGERRWTYEASFLQSRGGYGDFRCRGTWSNLHPNTTYEYQLAHYDREAQLRRPGLLQWTDIQTVSTLGPPQELAIERDGETITVRWKRQPDAWAYVVGLRGEGRSWWKRYEPSGEQTEKVMFHRVPEDISLSVDLISPPLEDGAEARPRWFDEVIVTGH